MKKSVKMLMAISLTLGCLFWRASAQEGGCDDPSWTDGCNPPGCTPNQNFMVNTTLDGPQLCQSYSVTGGTPTGYNEVHLNAIGWTANEVDPTPVSGQVCCSGCTMTYYASTDCSANNQSPLKITTIDIVLTDDVIEPSDNGWEWLQPNCEAPGFASTLWPNRGSLMAITKIGTMAF